MEVLVSSIVKQDLSVWNAREWRKQELTGPIQRSVGLILSSGDVYERLESSLSFSPDSTHLATQPSTATFRPPSSSRGVYERPESSLSFSPDSTHLAVASLAIDSSCEVWDARTWTRIRQYEGHADAVAAVQFSPMVHYWRQHHWIKPSVCGFERRRVAEPGPRHSRPCPDCTKSSVPRRLLRAALSENIIDAPERRLDLARPARERRPASVLAPAYVQATTANSPHEFRHRTGYSDVGDEFWSKRSS